MATNPPITIGPFANVPAPGSGVKSDWAQQITNYVLRTAWTNATLINSWAVSAGLPVPQYRKVGDVVEFRGIMKSGTIGSAAFVLPTGFRPAVQQWYLPCFSGTSPSTLGAIHIVADGSVVPVAPTVNTNVSLECVRFSITP